MTLTTYQRLLKARCDARATGRNVTAWGFESLPCNATRGLRSFADREGSTRYACAAPGHFANVERRFGHAESWESRKARIDAAILADPEAPR